MPNFLFPALPFLLLLTTIGHVLSQDDYFEQRKSPVMQEVQKRFGKHLIGLDWKGQGGNGIILGLLKDPVFRKALDMSDEQYERLHEAADDIRKPEKNPEVKRIYEEIEAIKTANGATLQNADEETKERFFNLHERSFELTTSTGDSLNTYNLTSAMEVTLTSEQKHKIKEVQLAAALSDVSVFPPSMFEALGLTNDQKQEMEKIIKDIEAEFDKPREELALRNLIVNNKLNDEMEKQGNTEHGLMLIKDADVRKELLEETNKIGESNQSFGKQFASQFQTKMLDVLTDEQWLRLQDMIDNPSGLTKMALDKIKEWREKKDVWSPGPDSWKPGDPIPEQYRQERNTRRNFPRRQESKPQE